MGVVFIVTQPPMMMNGDEILVEMLGEMLGSTHSLSYSDFLIVKDTLKWYPEQNKGFPLV